MFERGGQDQFNSSLSQIPTGKLEDMLRYAALSDEALDMAQVDRLLAELQARRPDEAGAPSADEAWETFQREYAGRPSVYLDCAAGEREDAAPETAQITPRKRRRPLRLAAIAAAAVILLIGIAQASGADVFGAVAHWTNEFFSLSSSTVLQEVVIVPDYAALEAMQFRDLQEALDAYGMIGCFVPRWLPDGFEQTELTCRHMSSHDSVGAVWQNENAAGLLRVQVTHYLSGSGATIYEKNEKPPEEYVYAGITHYILFNNNTISAVWQVEDIEAAILLPKAYGVDTLKRMIDSMY